MMDSRIAVVGENGSGKTTLLKILLGELDLNKGIRHTHRFVEILPKRFHVPFSPVFRRQHENGVFKISTLESVLKSFVFGD